MFIGLENTDLINKNHVEMDDYDKVFDHFTVWVVNELLMLLSRFSNRYVEFMKNCLIIQMNWSRYLNLKYSLPYKMLDASLLLKKASEKINYFFINVQTMFLDEWVKVDIQTSNTVCITKS